MALARLRAPRRLGACRLPGGGLIPDRGQFTHPRTARLARRDRCRARPCRGALARRRGRNAGAGRRQIRSGIRRGVRVLVRPATRFGPARPDITASRRTGLRHPGPSVLAEGGMSMAWARKAGIKWGWILAKGLGVLGVGWGNVHTFGHDLCGLRSPPLRGRCPTGQRGVLIRVRCLRRHPPLSPTVTSPPQGGRSEAAWPIETTENTGFINASWSIGWRRPFPLSA